MNEFETVDEAYNEVLKLREENKRLRDRLAEHDGCSRWGVRDAIAMKGDSSNPLRTKGDPAGYEVVSADYPRSRCTSCALQSKPALCGPAPCLREQRPDKMSIKYIAKKGDQTNAR